MLQLFEIIFEAEGQNDEFDMTEQNSHLIIFNQILKAFYPRPNLEVSRTFMKNPILSVIR